MTSVIRKQAGRIEALETEVRRYAAEAVMAITRVEALEAALLDACNSIEELCKTFGCDLHAATIIRKLRAALDKDAG